MTRETDTITSALPDEKRIEQDQEEKEDEDIEVDADHEVDDLADSKPKKKRRIIKLSDKKYECPHPECGKAYSRAEHLYRHQLNRMCGPTTITCYITLRKLTYSQIHRSKSTIATFRDVIAASCVQICAPGIRNDTQRKALICSGKMRSSTARERLAYQGPLLHLVLHP